VLCENIVLCILMPVDFILMQGVFSELCVVDLKLHTLVLVHVLGQSYNANDIINTDIRSTIHSKLSESQTKNSITSSLMKKSKTCNG